MDNYEGWKMTESPLSQTNFEQRKNKGEAAEKFFMADCAKKGIVAYKMAKERNIEFQKVSEPKEPKSDLFKYYPDIYAFIDKHGNKGDSWKFCEVKSSWLIEKDAMRGYNRLVKNKKIRAANFYFIFVINEIIHIKEFDTVMSIIKKSGKKTVKLNVDNRDQYFFDIKAQDK